MQVDLTLAFESILKMRSLLNTCLLLAFAHSVVSLTYQVQPASAEQIHETIALSNYSQETKRLALAFIKNHPEPTNGDMIALRGQLQKAIDLRAQGAIEHASAD